MSEGGSYGTKRIVRMHEDLDRAMKNQQQNVHGLKGMEVVSYQAVYGCCFELGMIRWIIENNRK